MNQGSKEVPKSSPELRSQSFFSPSSPKELSAHLLLFLICLPMSLPDTSMALLCLAYLEDLSKRISEVRHNFKTSLEPITQTHRVPRVVDVYLIIFLLQAHHHQIYALIAPPTSHIHININ